MIGKNTNPFSFYPRRITSVLQEVLLDTPVVCLLGSRQSGKTTLVRKMFPQRPYVSLDDTFDYDSAIDDPGGFIRQYPGDVTIDEIQRVPSLINEIKISVDSNRQPGRFLLTGSVNLLLVPGLVESLAGRMEIIELQPLTEAEKSGAQGNFLLNFLHRDFSLDYQEGLIHSNEVPLDERIMAGGYAPPLVLTARRGRDWRRQYIDSIVKRDIPEIFKIRNFERLSRLVSLLASRTGQLLNVTDLANSLPANRVTVERYLAYLERTFIIRRVPAWDSNTAKRLIKSPKIHFVDTGLAATLMDVPVKDRHKNRKCFGQLLESFVVQQLYSQLRWTDSDMRLWHYRDKEYIEVDAVLTLGDKVWGFEVKAGTSVRPQDLAGLKKLASRCGEDFQKGIIFYNGTKIRSFTEGRVLAVPVREIWTR